MDRSERRVLWLMAAPFVIGVTVLVVLPVLGTVATAVYRWDLVRPPRFLGLANFRELVDDPLFRLSLRNSLLFVAIAVPLRLVGALALSLLFHRPGGRTVAAGRTVVLVPTLIPDVAYALLWLWILNPLYGPLNIALAAIGLATPAWLSQPAPARWAVVLMAVFQLGEGFLIALVARRQVPDALHELAAVSGAGRWSRFVRITLPLMAPALLLVAMRDTISSFQATFVPALIVTEGGPPPYSTTHLSLFIYRNAFEYLRYGYAAAATVFMLLLTGSVLWLQYLLVRRWRGALRSHA
jgi:multiple sugar transport system permease protein